MQRKSVLLATALAIGLPVSASAATLDIEIIFGQGVTASLGEAVTAAEAFWENAITGYQNDALGAMVNGLEIFVSGENIDGAFGIEAKAGPTAVATDGTHIVATEGLMTFDLSDLPRLEFNDLLFDTALHEMAHAIGFGLLWQANGVYVNGTGEYTGANALATYQSEFDPLATFVPVELGLGPGDDNIHWDLEWAGGRRELMTSLIFQEGPVSDTTIASFADIGYSVNLDAPPAPVPLPASGLLLAGALSFLGAVRVRRSQVRRRFLS